MYGLNFPDQNWNVNLKSLGTKSGTLATETSTVFF